MDPRFYSRWPSYANRRMDLNNQPDLSAGEYRARLDSMGNPTGAQSYANYMASDDYASGWRPTGQQGQAPQQPQPGQGGVFAPPINWRWPRFTQNPGGGATSGNASDYLVPTQYNGIPNVIPVGANITDGTGSSSGGGGSTPGGGGGSTPGGSTSGSLTIPPWIATLPAGPMRDAFTSLWQRAIDANVPLGRHPTVGTLPQADPIPSYRDRALANNGGMGHSAADIIAGAGTRVPQEWLRTRMGA